MARFSCDQRMAQQLAGLTDKLERKILADGIRKATRQVLLPAIQASTPVGSPYTRVTRGRSGTSSQGGAFRRIRYRTETGGRLRRSLKVRQLRRRKGRVGSAVYTGTRAQLGIRGRGYYPAHQEYGFRARGRQRRRITVNQQYMKRPLLAQRTQWLNVVAQEMRAGLEREVRP
jgi:hypothetical protein